MKLTIFTHENVDYLIQMGQNKQDNWDLIDAAINTDIWFHVENEPSDHIILKNVANLRDIPRQVIKRCAYLCKINSKSKTQQKCNIMYTIIENVTKTHIVGQVHVEIYKTVAV